MRKLITLSFLILVPSLSYADCNNQVPSTCPPPYGQSNNANTIQPTSSGMSDFVEVAQAIVDGIGGKFDSSHREAGVSSNSSFCDGLTADCKKNQGSSSAASEKTIDPNSEVDQ